MPVSEREHEMAGDKVKTSPLSWQEMCGNRQPRYKPKGAELQELKDDVVPGTIYNRKPIPDKKFEGACQACTDQIEIDQTQSIYVIQHKKVLRFCCHVCLLDWVAQIAVAKNRIFVEPEGKCRTCGRVFS